MILPHLKSGIDRYVRDKVPTGGFLNAVLSNDLFNVIGRADTDSLLNLKDVCSYIYNHTPYSCWGSKEVVKEWLGR